MCVCVCMYGVHRTHEYTSVHEVLDILHTDTQTTPLPSLSYMPYHLVMPVGSVIFYIMFINNRLCTFDCTIRVYDINAYMKLYFVCTFICIYIYIYIYI